MHECPECGEACDCDGEDLWTSRVPANCQCATADAADAQDGDDEGWPDDNDPEYCECGVYLDGDMHPRHPKHPEMCEDCGDELEDDGPYAVPDEFDDDGTQDSYDGEVIT